MKKMSMVVLMLVLSALLISCGPPPEGGATGGDSGSGDSSAQAPAETPTPVVLATPTPKPAPPTPTPRPSPTPAPLEDAEPTEEPTEEAVEEEAVEEEAAEEEAAEAEEEAVEEEPTPEPEPTEVPAPAIFDDMVMIPAGTFTMGQNESKPKNGPAHEVELADYEIDRFEVTNADYAIFADASGYVTFAEQEGRNKTWRTAAEGKDSHPVVFITWDDAVAFCEWAGKRLPSEAEWERAARGEDARAYPWGEDFPADTATFGNMYETGLRDTFPVGAFGEGASPYEVFDMAGNVREWVDDFFLPYPGAAADADPFFGEENRVNRGGGWFDGQDGELVTTYNRNAGPPGTSANDDIGFRCARDPQ